MKIYLTNAAYGVLDYAAYPIGMLLVAPVILRNMGTSQYGIWAVVTAAISMGSIIASGFGDANIQHVASQRGLGRQDALVRAVRCMIGYQSSSRHSFRACCLGAGTSGCAALGLL